MKTNDGWEYKFHQDEHNRTFEVIPPPEALKSVTPKILFKYYALNCNSVDALKNSYLYASEPSQLNDPFDCHPNLIEYETNEIENIRKKREPQFRDYALPIERQNDVALRMNYYNKFRSIGIISMTTEPENTLMWAHYAQNKGFMLEFDVDKLNDFWGPYPINYSENLENYNENLEKVLCSDDGDHTHFLRQTIVKSKEWIYENEWRFLAPKNEDMYLPKLGSKKDSQLDRKFKYTNSLKSITLGSLFFDVDNMYQWNGQMSVNLTGLNLCVIQFAIQNNIDLYWIYNPFFFYSAEKTSFKLTRTRIFLKQIDENKYSFSLKDV